MLAAAASMTLGRMSRPKQSSLMEAKAGNPLHRDDGGLPPFVRERWQVI